MIVETLSVHSSRPEVQERTLNSFVTASMGLGVSFKQFFELLFLPAVYLRNLSHSPRSSSQKKTALHEQTTKMEGEPTAKNVQKGARFKIQRENEAHMLIRLALPERGKMRASVLINHL